MGLVFIALFNRHPIAHGWEVRIDFSGVPEAAAEDAVDFLAAIEEGGLAQMEEVMDAIESTGSITYTARRAEDEASRATAALTAIPDSPYKQALLDLAHFSAHRSH